jgi:hypothetical protein
MANQNENQDPRDARINELETQLQAVEKTHAFQAERADKLEADLKTSNEKHEFQKKRAGKLEAALKDLSTSAKAASPTSGIVVIVDGVTQTVIGDFRADNTFVEVKRGHCPEGVTLVAIDKRH